MKGKFTKLLCGVLCLSTGTAAFAACGEQKFDNGPQSLSIWICDAGYGTAWLDNTLAAFAEQDWVKSAYPDLKWNVVPNKTDSLYGFEVTNAGASVNEYDLIVSCAPGGAYFGSGNFEELTDVYESTVPGESVTLQDKMLDDILFHNGYEVKNAEGEYEVGYYGTPWVVGSMGLFYNEAVLQEAYPDGYDMPNTTNELVAFCQALDTLKYGESGGPIVGATGANYWIEMYKIWWAQYNGIQEYTNFWYGIEGNERSGEVLGQKGRLYSLQAIDSLIGSDNGLIHAESTMKDYKTMQSYFLAGRGAFMMNGDWLANEMSGKDSSNIRMMKNPVISNIVERCSSVLGDGTNADARLSFVIDCVDADDTFEQAAQKYATAGHGTLVKADFERIYEARNMAFAYGGMGLHVPTYATAKALAKDFIRFTATDIAIKALMDTGKGFKSGYSYTPSETELASYNPLSRDSLENSKKNLYIPPNQMFRLNYLGGLQPIEATVNAVDTSFMGVNPLNPVDMYEYDYKYYTGKQNPESTAKADYSLWATLLTDSGY